MRFFVTEASRNTVEVEAENQIQASQLVSEQGTDKFKSIHYEAAVVKVVSEWDED